MKLKLLSAFQSDDFPFGIEIPMRYPKEYARYWDEFENTFERKSPTDKRKRLSDKRKSPTDLPIKDVKFTHASQYAGESSNRYSSIDKDSLIRPLHVLEISTNLELLDSVNLLLEISTNLELLDSVDLPTKETTESVLNVLKPICESEQPVLIRVYKNRISLLEVDLPIGVSLFEVSRGDNEEIITAVLNCLQETGVKFAEKLVSACQQKILTPLFHWIKHYHSLSRIRKIIHEHKDPLRHDEKTTENTQGKSSPVLWTTRSLIFENNTYIRGDIRNIIISHWLKDVGGPEIEEEVKNVQENSNAYVMQWVNHLFREDSYPKPDPAPDLYRNTGEKKPARPFFYAWEALINAQYYYAAFDVFQTRIYYILAESLDGTGGKDLKTLKRDLDKVVGESNLLFLDFQENWKFYQRSVASKMRELFDYWRFEEVLMKQIERGIEFCKNRLAELHKRAEKKSSLYTDGVLLAIGVTSVFGIGLSLLEIGRMMAQDASYAVYERGSFNIATWIATHATDSILLLALILSVGLVALYYYFKTKETL